jgi:hypothetical protein
VLPLGREAHPLSVAVLSTTNTSTTLILVVSARAGDWSRALATLAQSQVSSFEVDLGGPFAHGGSWALSGSGRQEASLLLLAGGTGITGWLPALATAGATERQCHLVWCVQREADYQALARRLPPGGIVKVTVFVTQPSAAATGGGSAGSIELLPNASSPPLVEDGIDQPLEQSPSMLRANQIQVTDTSATVTVTGPTQDSAGSLASVSLAATLTGLVVGWLFRLRGRGVGGQAEGQGMNYLEEQHGPYRSLVDYALLRRFFPMVPVFTVAALTIALGSYAVERARRKRRNSVARSGYERVREGEGEREGLLLPALAESTPLPVAIGLAVADTVHTQDENREIVNSAHTEGHKLERGEGGRESSVSNCSITGGPERRPRTGSASAYEEPLEQEPLLAAAPVPRPPCVTSFNSAHTRGHEIRTGRPDVDALVREAVEALASHQGPDSQKYSV